MDNAKAQISFSQLVSAIVISCEGGLLGVIEKPKRLQTEKSKLFSRFRWMPVAGSMQVTKRCGLSDRFLVSANSRGA
jgi:hypothetical protein